VRTRLVEDWIDQGREGFTPDVEGHPLLRIQVDAATITYERDGRRHLNRIAELALTYALTGADGRIRTESTCSDRLEDRVSRDQAEALADDRFAATQPVIPGPSGLRRWLEPVVLVSASAVGTWLFFNLRSRRADNR